MKNSNNYSVKEEIQKALLRLINKKAVTDITVTELVKEANVARVSFYRHYSSISDVLDSIAKKSAELFSEQIIPPVNSKDERKWREFLFFYFYQISKNVNEFLVSNVALNTDVSNRINTKVGDALKKQPEPTMQETYSWVGKLGLLQGISQTWVASGMRESPEEMIDYVMSIIKEF